MRANAFFSAAALPHARCSCAQRPSTPGAALPGRHSAGGPGWRAGWAQVHAPDHRRHHRAFAWALMHGALLCGAARAPFWPRDAAGLTAAACCGNAACRAGPQAPGAAAPLPGEPETLLHLLVECPAVRPGDLRRRCKDSEGEKRGRRRRQGLCRRRRRHPSLLAPRGRGRRRRRRRPPPCPSSPRGAGWGAAATAGGGATAAGWPAAGAGAGAGAGGGGGAAAAKRRGGGGGFSLCMHKRCFAQSVKTQSEKWGSKQTQAPHTMHESCPAGGGLGTPRPAALAGRQPLQPAHMPCFA
jgi:hypothetical protein